MTESTPEVLPPTGSDIAEYRPTEAALAQLRQQLAEASIDCTTTAGDQQARQSRLALVRLRTALEEKRKELKAPHLEAGKRIDDEAKRITGAILEMEKPIDDAIRAEEARRERVRAERERAERERKARNEGLIDALRQLPLEYVAAPSSVIEPALAELIERTVAVDDDYREQAAAALAAAIAKLREVLSAARENERLQAELRAQREEQERAAAAERAELERLRAEQAERDRAAAEERRIADEAAAAERKRLADEQAAAHRAEQERLAAERAELERLQRIEEARRRDEAAKAEAKRQEKLRREEAKAIEQATTLETMREAVALLEALGAGGELVTRKLKSLVARAETGGYNGGESEDPTNA